MSMQPNPWNTGPQYPPVLGAPLPPSAPIVVAKGRWWHIIRSNLVVPAFVIIGWSIAFVFGYPQIWSGVLQTGYTGDSYSLIATLILLVSAGAGLLLVDFPIFVAVQFAIARLLGGKGNLYSLSSALTRYQVPVLADLTVCSIIIVRESATLKVLFLSPGIATALIVLFQVLTFVLSVLTNLALPIPALKKSQGFSTSRAFVSELLAFAVYSIVVFPISAILLIGPILLEIMLLTWIHHLP